MYEMLRFCGVTPGMWRNTTNDTVVNVSSNSLAHSSTNMNIFQIRIQSNGMASEFCLPFSGQDPSN